MSGLFVIGSVVLAALVGLTVLLAVVGGWPAVLGAYAGALLVNGVFLLGRYSQ